MEDVCVWHAAGDDLWAPDCSCGSIEVRINPRAMRFRWCPYCGRELRLGAEAILPDDRQYCLGCGREIRTESGMLCDECIQRAAGAQN